MAEIKLAGRSIPLPASPLARRVIGAGFLAMGVFGFLPVLGFWMIPVGLAVLSVDSGWFRRLRRRSDVGATRVWRSLRLRFRRQG